MNHDPLRDSRLSYARGSLDEAHAPGDPCELLSAWLADARQAGIREPNAMTLATVAEGGSAADARIVLLRGLDARGLDFYTNYESRKGRELAACPGVTLLFYWAECERQVRLDGVASRLAAEESDAYFASRPRGHRLSAWASPQSRAVAGRDELEAAMAEAERRFPGEVPRPPHWGGYRVVPQRFEFWQGREDRVHDRIAYTRAGDTWQRNRLAP
jgi:pyridoxamine 5'-phosphate oxidase